MFIRWLKAPNSKVVITFEESFNLSKIKDKSNNIATKMKRNLLKVKSNGKDW